jgi:hypothetical protein
VAAGVRETYGIELEGNVVILDEAQYVLSRWIQVASRLLINFVLDQ